MSMSLLIKNWSKANYEELLMWARIGANNAMIGEFTEVEELHPHGRLIDADEFVKQHKEWYCENCKRRKNSNGCFVYEIGGVPCRACDIGDMIDAVDDAPTVIEADYPPSTPLEQVWTELFGEDGE